MHLIEIPDKNKSFQIASHWDDCNQEQVHFILKYAFDVMAGTLSISEFRVKVFKCLSGIKFGIGYLIKQKLKLNTSVNEVVYKLSHNLCDWIFNKNDTGEYELNYETVQNFFPVLLDRYYGPEALLSDMSLGEFKTALGALDLYFESKEDPEEALIHLNYFLAVLYRPKKDNSARVSFHNYNIDENLFQKVPLWQKQCIVIWFTFCVKCLQSEDIVINGIECNFDVLFPEATGAKTNKVNLGWTGILLDVAESGVFGDAGLAAQTSLYDILLFMLKKHQDQSKQK